MGCVGGLLLSLQLIAFWFEYLAQDKHPQLQQQVALLPGATTFLLSNVAPEEAGLLFEALKVRHSRWQANSARHRQASTYMVTCMVDRDTAKQQVRGLEAYMDSQQDAVWHISCLACQVVQVQCPDLIQCPGWDAAAREGAGVPGSQQQPGR
jgi:hypothetical protein